MNITCTLKKYFNGIKENSKFFGEEHLQEDIMGKEAKIQYMRTKDKKILIFLNIIGIN